MTKLNSITLISDCRDDNAFARMSLRCVSTFNAPIVTIGTKEEIAMSGNIVDALDAVGDKPSLVLCTVAPRSGVSRKWRNGAPFAYFKSKKSLVVTSIDGDALLMLKKFKIIDQVEVVHIPVTMRWATKEKLVTDKVANYVIDTQFRYYEFLPRVAEYLLNDKGCPHEPYSLSEVREDKKAIWWIDCFGNCKSTILPEDINFVAGKIIETKWGSFKTYNHLKDVPDLETGIVVGSSGYGDKRLLELVTQGANTAEKLKISIGDLFF